MGLAASQARLLSITSRISDNELRAQLINNQKMRLATESSKVSENYINALNKTNLMFANYDSEDNAQSVPLTFNNLTAFNQYNNQYGLTNSAGNILVSETEAKKYQACMGADDKQAEFLRQHGIEYTTSYWDKISEQLGNSGIAYTADQLKVMYEGNPDANITAYNDTIKTQEYTDFSGYLDDFIIAKAYYDNALEQATKDMVNTIGDKEYSVGGFTSTLNKLIEADPVTLFQNNANTLKTFIQTVLTDNCETGADITGFINDHFNTNGDNYINMTYNGGKFTQNGTYENLGLGANAKLYSNNASQNSLTYTTGGAVYMNIGQIDADDDGNAIMGWVKIGTTSGSTFTAETSDMKIYKKDGSNMIVAQNVADDGSTQDFYVNSKSYNANKFVYSIPVQYDDASGNTQTGSQTVTINYPTLNTTSLANGTGTGTVSGVTTAISGDKNGMSAEINEAIRQLMTDTLAFIRQNIKDADASLSTDPDIQKALAECINIGQNLADTILGKNDDGTPKVEVTKDNIEDLYNYVMDVADGLASPNDPCLGQTPKEEFGSVVNAYILDTVMDIFGEPVYGYLYTNGSGTVQEKNGNVDASAEAKWFINLFEKIQSSGYQVLANGLASSTEWLQFAFENGIVVLEQVNSDNAWQGITHTSCSDISEQTDRTAETIAEAEYNKAMRQIEAKDEMFDLELKNIDTEHSSLEAEYESVKKAMSGNIERNFQMYS